MRSKLTALGAVLFLVTACAVDAPVSSTAPGDAVAAKQDGNRGAPKFWDVGATVGWNQHAATLIERRQADAIRFMAYISMAQFRAAEAANSAPGPHPPVSAAIGAATATVMRALFPLPADVADIDRWLAEQRAADPWPGARHADFAAGVAIGNAVGGAVLAYMTTDNWGLVSPGTPPVGPGRWVFGGALARGGYGARPFYLASGNQFLPAPPPAFDGPAFRAALAEVRQIADTRTPEQLAIALYWHAAQSPRSAEAMNSIARRFIVQYRRKDAEAARILFVMNSAAFDAAIGCFHAKFTYWYIRPPQADPMIRLPIVMPPHPSYPSAHSCLSGASTTVLSAMFPSEARYLAGVAQEASLSRLYAGIHYRFDMEAGLALGARVAGLAVAADLDEVAPLP